jgi:ferredoxin
MLEELLELLRQHGEIYGPVQGADGVLRFAPIIKGVLPDLTALRTMLPPKKYLLHPCETILNYSSDEGYQLPPGDGRPVILFGLHPCDLAGINYLDRLFLGEDPDPLYAARRSTMILVGISCMPDEFCTCHLSCSPLDAFSDLFLQPVEDGYVITSFSSAGDKYLNVAKDILKNWHADIPEDTRRYFGRPALETVLTEIDATLPEWQQLADHCLGCGACSLCCPTCACFDVLELGGLDACSARRVRRWDNCLFKSHGQVAGGMNFRKDRAERFRYRYRHKYHGFGPLQQIPSCVGCGRCRVACPAGLDLRLLAKRLVNGMP